MTATPENLSIHFDPSAKVVYDAHGTGGALPRTKDTVRPSPVAPALQVMQRTLARMEHKREPFKSLEDFYPNPERAARVRSLGGVPDERFQLVQKVCANGVQLAITGVGEFSFTHLPDRSGYVVEATALQGMNHPDAGVMVDVNGLRNAQFDYERCKLKWTTTDEVHASTLVEEALNALVLKASIDKALAGGMAQHAWFEADKLRHLTAGSVGVQRGEYPSFGRDPNDGTDFQPHLMKLAPVSLHQNLSLSVPGQYLGDKGGMQLYLVPRTEIILAVPEENVKSMKSPLQVGQYVALHSKSGSLVEPKPITRDQALERLDAYVLDTPHARGLREAAAARLTEAAVSVLRGEASPEQALTTVAGRVGAADLAKLVEAGREMPGATKGPQPDLLRQEGLSWAAHPLYAQAESISDSTFDKVAPRPALIESRLTEQLRDPRRLATASLATVIPLGKEVHRVAASQVLDAPARRRFEALGKTQGLQADTSRADSSFFKPVARENRIRDGGR